MRWRRSGRRGWESVHDTAIRSAAPTILFDRPRQDPPPLASFVSQLGPPFCGCRVQSMRNGCGVKPFKFRPLAKDDAVPTVRKADAWEI
jgi:hypothetical protein